MANTREEEPIVIGGNAFRITLEIVDCDKHLKNENLVNILHNFGNVISRELRMPSMQLSIRDPLIEGFVYGPND